MNLQKSELFEEISSRDCQKMFGCLKVMKKEYKSGECIYSLEENEGQIGILESGSAYMERIDIDGNSTMLDHLGPGEIFGEMVAFSNQYGDSFRVICEKNCKVGYVPYKKIISPCGEACACHHQMIENLLSIISEKAQALSERIEIISNRTTRGKLLYYFQIQATKNGSRHFELPFSVTTLAEYLCVDRSAMAREISNMKSDGILEMSRRDVTLL